MALQKPYGISINGIAINASADNTITWLISGDVQTAYQVDFYLNSSNALVFSSGKITSYYLSYKLPAYTLINGNEYKVTVTAYNSKDETQTSDAVVFQTSGRPVITIATIGTVSNFSNLFSATYTQYENVPLQSWNVNLYNSDKELIDHSDLMTELPMEYLFTDLETETSYYIEFQATSEIGLIGSSGLIKFDVLYLRPKQNVTMETKNIENAGIEISWFVKQITFQNNGGVFLDNDKIDLRNGTATVNKGFNIAQDFSLKVWLNGINNTVPLLTLKGDNGYIVLSYNAIESMFVVKKITNNISSTWKNDEYNMTTFVTPYQPSGTTTSGEKAVVLIQQINSDITISVTKYD